MKTLVPKRRFAGFSGEWEPYQFSEIVTRISKSSKEENLPRIEYEDIVSGQGRLNKNIFLKESDKYGIEFESGDILFGKLRPYLQNWMLASHIGIAVGDWWVLRPNGVCSRFVYSLIQGKRYQEIANLSIGTKMPRSDWNTVSQTEFLIPAALKEQIEIGSFFSKLDNLISLNQQKLDKLKATKSAYLSEMFPQEGELYPRRRFPGFTEPWERTILGDAVPIVMGQSPSSINYTNNPNDNVLVQGNADIVNGWVLPRVWTTQITKEAQKGDIIMSVRAPVGDVGKTNYDCVLGRGVAGIKGNEFIFQLLSLMKYKGVWDKLTTGSTFESINSNDIREITVLLPTLSEQTKIGNFFSNLDSLITAQQNKLEKLKALKQAYLAEMFV